MKVEIGTKKSMLTVTSIFIGREGKKTRTFILCKCNCGNERKMTSNDFIKGVNISCGCENIKRTAKQNYIDGRRKTPEYLVYYSMINRCYKETSKSYKHYGGRGIKVCDRWLKDYINFITDMGNRPTNKHSIERINNNGNYEPANCKWATIKEQNNNKRNNIKNK